MFGSSLPPVVCRRAQVVFTLFVFVCAQWYPTHIMLCFCFVFLRAVYHMLLFSLDCPILEISIFSNSSHLEWRAGLSDTMLKGTHTETTPSRFGLIWFSGFRGEDLNVIFYQHMPNLHNQYKSAERKISQKNPEYMLNYSLPCSCS